MGALLNRAVTRLRGVTARLSGKQRQVFLCSLLRCEVRGRRITVRGKASELFGAVPYAPNPPYACCIREGILEDTEPRDDDDDEHWS